jgi:hypothetical protein
MFENLEYDRYCSENKIPEMLGLNLEVCLDIDKKLKKDLYESVDPNNKTPFPPELDDLTRLHFLTRTRRVTTILEFGVGKSSIVLADALRRNKEEYGVYVKRNLRRANPFTLFSIDNNEEGIDCCRKDFPKDLLPFIKFHKTDVEMTTFNGRACTMYQRLPNICPDFIYLDAPDQFSIRGEVRGISTDSPDRLPMSADILLIEPFLLPRTLILIDGRTANARFLQNNFQRNWEYVYYVEEDIHTFELMEEPLGVYNAKQIEFCL